jgi:1,2-dihydroxy-3-keto-5-methylthiopentene dioxygenase
MSRLTVFDEKDARRPSLDTSDGAEIARVLKGLGVRFERWRADRPLPAGATQEQVLKAYKDSVDRLTAECGYQAADVIGLTPEHPDKDAMRTKFLSEHTHGEDEVRFFVEGSGTFYMHVGGKVHMVLCEKGDLISVPAKTRHWFDMGPKPRFTCIRLFTNPAGWVANYTGDPIADRFPRMAA